MLPGRELRLGAVLLLSMAVGCALIVLSVDTSPSVLVQTKKQLHQELNHIARTSALIDEPTDVADGNLYRDPSKEAKLGSVHSSDLFAAGMREAKAGERRFEQAVAKEKEKAVQTELASLRKSLPKVRKAHTAVGRAQSEWAQLEATADAISGEAASDEKKLARKPNALSLQHASLSKLGLEEEHVAVRAGKARKTAAKQHSAKSRRHSVAVARKQVKEEEAEVKREQEQDHKLRAQIRRLRMQGGAERKGKMQQLEEDDGLAIRHQHRIIHQTRPGAVGGIMCSPPFCNSDSLPAILPGEEP